MRGSKGRCVRMEYGDPPPRQNQISKLCHYNYLKYALDSIPRKTKISFGPLEKNSGSAHASVPVKVVLAIINHLTFFFDRNSLNQLRQSAGTITCLIFTL